MSAAAWWLLWGTCLIQGGMYLRECRLRDRAEARALALQRWIADVSCRCGEVAAVTSSCVDHDGWHHCVNGPCFPRHEEVTGGR